MTMTDPIADLFTRIRNAQQVHHDRLLVPGSKIKEEVCRILKQTHFIRDYEVREAAPGSEIEIELAYTADGEPAIRRLRRVSTSGRRVYEKSADLKPVLSGLGREHYFHLSGSADRRRGARARRRRRSPVRDLVAGVRDVENWQGTNRNPVRREGELRRRGAHRRRPEGQGGAAGQGRRGGDRRWPDRGPRRG